MGLNMLHVAPAARAALERFREDWRAQGGPNAGLDIHKCTVYGGTT